MRFKIATDHANRLFTYARAMQLAKQQKGLFSVIQCNITNNILTAEFITPHSCAEYKCRVMDSEDDDFWIAPPPQKYSARTYPVVTVEDDGTSTTWSTADGSQTIQRPCIDKRLRLEAYWDPKKPEGTVYVDAALLTQVLSAYTGQKNPVKLEVLGAAYGIVIDAGDVGRTFVLPCVRGDEDR